MAKVALDSQTLGEIVSILRDATKAGSGRELRKAARLQVQARVLMARWINGAPSEPRTVMSRDLSATGIGIMTGRSFAQDDELVVLLPRMRSVYEGVVGKVVFVAESATGIFTIGTEFTELLNHAATQEVLKFFLNSSIVPKGAVPAAAQAAAPAPAEARK